MRIAAGIIALAYLLTAGLALDPAVAGRLAVFLVIPLGFIWFSEAIGDYTGAGFTRSPVTSASPAWMIAIGGWVVLLLPLVFGLIWWFGRSG